MISRRRRWVPAVSQRPAPSRERPARQDCRAGRRARPSSLGTRPGRRCSAPQTTQRSRRASPPDRSSTGRLPTVGRPASHRRRSGGAAGRCREPVARMRQSSRPRIRRRARPGSFHGVASRASSTRRATLPPPSSRTHSRATTPPAEYPTTSTDAAPASSRTRAATSPEMLGLRPKITGAVAHRLHDDSRPASRAQRCRPAAEAIGHYPRTPAPGGPGRDLFAGPDERSSPISADDGNHSNRHDQQQRHGCRHRAPDVVVAARARQT